MWVSCWHLGHIKDFLDSSTFLCQQIRYLSVVFVGPSLTFESFSSHHGFQRDCTTTVLQLLTLTLPKAFFLLLCSPASNTFYDLCVILLGFPSSQSAEMQRHCHQQAFSDILFPVFDTKTNGMNEKLTKYCINSLLKRLTTLNYYILWIIELLTSEELWQLGLLPVNNFSCIKSAKKKNKTGKKNTDTYLPLRWLLFNFEWKKSLFIFNCCCLFAFVSIFKII